MKIVEMKKAAAQEATDLRAELANARDERDALQRTIKRLVAQVKEAERVERALGRIADTGEDTTE